MVLKRVLISARFFTFIWLEANFIFFRLSLSFKINRKTDEKVINPRPPVWINIKITAFPKFDHCEKVSLTERPVTHVAEVEVNKQSRKEAVWLWFDDMGKNNNKLPDIMIDTKL